MMVRRWDQSTWTVVLMMAVVTSCGLSQQQQYHLEAWLMCDDCMLGEIDSVSAIGEDAVDPLAEALSGPTPQAVARIRNVNGLYWSRLTNPASDSARYVDGLVSNYVASYQKRAATALANIRTTNAIRALQRALARDSAGIIDYRRDVVTTIHESMYEATGAFQWAAVQAGTDHTCAVATSGRVYCWGLRADGRLGDGSVGGGSALVPSPIASRVAFDSVSADSAHTCALSELEQVYCWGDGTTGQLGHGGTQPRPRPTPVASTVGFRALQAGGGQFSCALSSSGEAYCWGDNSAFQLGIGPPRQTVTTPERIAGGLQFVQLSVSRGGTHACGVTTSGLAYCWGTSIDSALGTGTTTSATPELVVGVSSFSLVSAGFRHSCGIAGDQVYCWGSGGDGQLGRGSTPPSGVPVSISPPPASLLPPSVPPLVFASVSAGRRHSCAVTRDGIAFCWGRGEEGQLGDGRSSGSTVPVLVSGSLRWKSLHAADHTCGITMDGTLYCWGPGTNGEIGDDESQNRNEPTLVAAPATL